MNTVQGTRRTLLKGTALASLLGISGITQLLQSVSADYPQAAFDSEDMDTTMKALFPEAAPEESTSIKLKAPDIAENGSVVPIQISTDIENVRRIAIVVENNPAPLAASFDLGSGAVSEVSTRIKMGKTSNVYALVEAEGGLFSTSKEVKVTIGGCGG